MRTQDAVHHAWSAPTTEYWAPTGSARVGAQLTSDALSRADLDLSEMQNLGERT
jgi:hypothetical protein